MKSDHQRQTRQGSTDRKVVSHLAHTHTGCSINVNLKLQMCSLGSHTLIESGSQLIPPCMIEQLDTEPTLTRCREET